MRSNVSLPRPAKCNIKPLKDDLATHPIGDPLSGDQRVREAVMHPVFAILSRVFHPTNRSTTHGTILTLLSSHSS